jgi:HD-like signal output (HDOD) protein
MLAANLGQLPGRPAVKNINQAVGWLGRARCQSFLWMVLLGDQIQNWHAASPRTRNRLFRHSLLTASLAQLLMAATDLTPWALPSGMAHDVGHLLIAAPGARLEVTWHEEYDTPPAQAAAAAPNCNHALLGQELLRFWNAPAPLLATAAFHHQPALAPPEWRGLVAAVRLADLACEFADSNRPVQATRLFHCKEWLQAADVPPWNTVAAVPALLVNHLPEALVRSEQLANQLAL